MTSHKCPAPNCARSVDDSMLACRAHWYALPMNLRRAIWSTWRRGDDLAHRGFVREAIAFWRGR